MSQTIAAYTPPTSPYPPYVNISREVDGDVTITVRSPARDAWVCETRMKKADACDFFSHDEPGPTCPSCGGVTRKAEDAGHSASIRLSHSEWRELFSQILGPGRAVPPHGSGP